MQKRHLPLFLLLILGSTHTNLWAYSSDLITTYGEEANLTGSRDNTETGGLVGSGSWRDTKDTNGEDDNGFADDSNSNAYVSLSWDITENGDGTWNYEYTWTGGGVNIEENDSRISHFTLELSESCKDDNGQPVEGCVQPNRSPLEYGALEGINFAVKFDSGAETINYTSDENDTDSVVYSFTSNRNPVWGNFCLKDGDGKDHDACPASSFSGPTYLWNAGFESTEGVFIARPNGSNNGGGGEPSGSVPLPGTLALLTLGLPLIGWRGRKREIIKK